MTARQVMEDFNPRARVGRDQRRFESVMDLVISIHAPAWGATRSWKSTDGSMKFQSTRPRGARLYSNINNNYDNDISIHAPAWGATGFAFFRCVISAHFNPRARVGRDSRRSPFKAAQEAFQSTRPRGARRHRTHGIQRQQHFNPRARVGRDDCWKAAQAESAKISIHAPAWGATYKPFLLRRHCLISIHAPAWGATALWLCPCSVKKFQSTRPRGARRRIRRLVTYRPTFQSTRPRGARQYSEK